MLWLLPLQGRPSNAVTGLQPWDSTCCMPNLDVWVALETTPQPCWVPAVVAVSWVMMLWDAMVAARLLMSDGSFLRDLLPFTGLSWGGGGAWPCMQHSSPPPPPSSPQPKKNPVVWKPERYHHFCLQTTHTHIHTHAHRCHSGASSHCLAAVPAQRLLGGDRSH